MRLTHVYLQRIQGGVKLHADRLELVKISLPGYG
jgi:hypothetical protein